MIRRFVPLVVLGTLPLTLACGDPAAPVDPEAPGESPGVAAARRPFLGAWTLSRIERRDADGALIGAPMEDRTGYLIYDGSGHMGVTLMRPDRVPYQGDVPTADEALSQYGTYTSYFGRFTVDEAAGVVIHHLEGSVNPSGAGADYRRSYQLTENALVLQPPPSEDGTRSFLTWERMPALPDSELTETHRELFGVYRVESVSRHTTDGYELPVDQYETAYIFYAPSGHMSVHLMRPGRAPFADARPTAEEALAATETYGSYFGPFTVNEIAGCLTCPGPRDEGYLVHHRVGSENPNDSGTDAERYFELSDTHLTLRPPVRVDEEGRQVVTAIRWARLSSGG